MSKRFKMYIKGIDVLKINRRKKSIQACESIVRANVHGTSAGTKDKGRRGDEKEPGRCKKKRKEKEKEKERRLSSSLKCVGECELVSRESPLSVASGVPPSVILSARPYFVVHAHAPSIACTHAAAVAVHACERARTAHRASAFRQSCTARARPRKWAVFFDQSKCHTQPTVIYRDLRICFPYVDLFYNQRKRRDFSKSSNYDVAIESHVQS